MTGFVYAIEGPEGLVKIGHSVDPVKRARDIRSCSAGPVRLLGMARGDRVHEADLHELAAGERVRGEWFRKGRVISLFLSMLPAPRRIQNRCRQRHAPVRNPDLGLIKRIRQRLQAVQLSPRAASLKAGGSAGLVRKIIDGSVVSPRSDTMANLARVLKTTPDWLLNGGPERPGGGVT